MQAASPNHRLVEWLGATQAPASEWDDVLGGKGASLERLLRMGAPTPPGFCVTTRAFRHHLDTGANPNMAARAIAALPAADARKTLTQMLTDAPLTPPVSDQLDNALQRLAAESDADAPRFAVRSSAMGEDSSFASFAGIHDTELEVVAADVPAAVRRCWASLWSERALEYRSFRGLPFDGAMAVVVQVLVPADAAAVVFTRHPVTQREDQLLVNAVHGLGEALVSGTVTPDEVVLDKGTLETVALTPGEGTAVLNHKELRDLATIAVGLEEQFGGPIDIEAALAGGGWHILQARPITA
jgi:phosphoenolpyruvate synthase/pyruvate phosphate dikinase